MTSFLALLILALASSGFTLELNIPLQKVDLFERLGLNDESTAQGAFEDGRLDAILALGGDIYTAQLGVGTPQQPLDFVLNFMGGQISLGVGDLPLVIGKNDVKNETEGNETMFNNENEAILAFNSSASSTFMPRPDIHFNTVINPFPWSFNAVGSIAEENIQLPYTKDDTNTVILRERMLGHVEHIGGEIFGKLKIGGILSVGNQSQIARNAESSLSSRLILVLGKEKTEFRLRQSPFSSGREFPCKEVNFRINLLDTVENQTDSLVNNLDTYKFQITGVGLAIPPYMAYEDKEERIAVVNPNSMFIQGPRKTVQIWAKMANAVQIPIGRQQLYVINCNEQFGPLTFKAGRWNEYSLAKDLLQFELPSNLLPKNKCLWAIQEGTEEQDFWIIGRPFFKQYCLVLDLPNGKIDFPEIIPAVENGLKKTGKWP